MVGSTLGHYRVRERIGAGGMGEVYLAYDEQLDRQVAIKVLRSSTVDDPDSRARLIREARTASKLNHPSICTIHEVGEADGRAYIAMELMEGQPLSVRLEHGALPVKDVVRFALHIADALAHAHSRNVIHRDLKCTNVMITPEGRAKILDFGLAKQLNGNELTELTTLSHVTLTQPGGLGGTLAYMSPEQLRGFAADARSDIWALGVVLYEMAAGMRPFHGQTAFELSGAILNQPARSLPSKVPIALRALIERCLEKEPARRYQRASEVHAALEAIQFSAGAMTAPEIVERAAPFPEPSRSRDRAPEYADATTTQLQERLAVLADAERSRRRVFAVALTAAGVAAAITFLGFFTTIAFNVTLGRSGPFAQESPFEWLVWGVRSLVAPVVLVSMFLLGWSLVRWTVRTTCRVVPRLDRRLARIQSTCVPLLTSLGFYDAGELATVVAVFGSLALIGTIWWYSDLWGAVMTYVTLADASTLAPLQPSNSSMHSSWGITRVVIAFAIGLGLARVIRLRRAQSPPAPGRSLLPASVVFVVAVVMVVLPWRLVYQSRFERIDLSGSRCYQIGRDGDRLLLYCPEAAIPRTTIVPTSDPRLRPTGIVESIFTPPGESGRRGR
jgi:tRNA A-37 threonylcarbamoyl transferase component Bud32